jgi:hypothetical protein
MDHTLKNWLANNSVLMNLNFTFESFLTHDSKGGQVQMHDQPLQEEVLGSVASGVLLILEVFILELVVDPVKDSEPRPKDREDRVPVERADEGLLVEVTEFTFVDDLVADVYEFVKI